VSRGYGCEDWSPDVQRLATSHPDRTVHIRDIASGEERLIFDIFPDPTPLDGSPSPYELSWSPDGTRIILADFDGGESYVFDASTGERLLTLSGGVWCPPNWSPDNTRLAAGRGVLGIGEGLLVVWDATTGEEILALPTESYACGVRWSPDGSRLVVPLLFNRGNPSQHIVDANTGEILLTYSRHIGMANGGWWSPDGARVVTTGDDATRIWDPVTGGEYAALDTANWIAEFSPDGSRLATIGKESVLRIWRVFPDTESLIAYARECCVLRELTSEERQQFGLPER
jgi:WD40 repeat protein